MLVNNQAILFPFEKELKCMTHIISLVSYIFITNAYKEYTQTSQKPV